MQISERIFLRLQKLLGSKRLDSVIAAHQNLQDRVGHFIRLNRKAMHMLARAEVLSDEILSGLMQAANQVESALAAWQNTLATNIIPLLEEWAEKLGRLQSEIATQASHLRQTLPALNEKIKSVQQILNTGSHSLE